MDQEKTSKGRTDEERQQSISTVPMNHFQTFTLKHLEDYTKEPGKKPTSSNTPPPTGPTPPTAITSPTNASTNEEVSGRVAGKASGSPRESAIDGATPS